MTNQKLTDITIVLDRSGSMESVRDRTIEGFNTFLRTQREERPEEAGECTVSLIQFDDLYEVVYAGRPVNIAENLRRDTFCPRGMTALLDAMGKTIKDTGARYAAMEEARRPGKVLVVIITDGGENHSREFTRERINEMIKEHRERYAWDFIFLGANQDAIAAGASMGLQFGKTMSYASNDVGTQAAFASVGSYAARSRRFASGAAATLSNAFVPEDRAAQAAAGVDVHGNSAGGSAGGQS